MLELGVPKRGVLPHLPVHARPRRVLPLPAANIPIICAAQSDAGTRFAASAAARPVLDVLARRGLGIIELGRDELAEAARAAGLAYASAAVIIDEAKLADGANVVHEAFGLGGSK